MHLLILDIGIGFPIMIVVCLAMWGLIRLCDKFPETPSIVMVIIILLFIAWAFGELIRTG